MSVRDLQREAMRIYQTLMDLREDWAGALILCCGDNCALSGAPAAVSIAGGTMLAIDSEASAMKGALRAGTLDFVVNTLDEALRTLKNEIRQKRPLSVGLIADVDAALGEMVTRGVQPELQLVPAGCPDLSNLQLETLRSRGMPYRLTLSAGDHVDFHPIRPFLILFGKRHYECFLPAANVADLRELDSALLAAIPTEDTVRRRWLQRVPQYVRAARSAGRWMWLSDEEVKALAMRGITPRQR